MILTYLREIAAMSWIPPNYARIHLLRRVSSTRKWVPISQGVADHVNDIDIDEHVGDVRCAQGTQADRQRSFLKQKK